MAICLVTESAGLIGSESVRVFANKGMDVVGLGNDMCAAFFGADASTAWMREMLKREVKRYRHLDIDIRDQECVFETFSRYGKDIALVVHTAAQPSHDWAAREPLVDFSVNANGMLNLLEATRRFAPEVVFIFTSTNKSMVIDRTICPWSNSIHAGRSLRTIRTRRVYPRRCRSTRACTASSERRRLLRTFSFRNTVAISVCTRRASAERA